MAKITQPGGALPTSERCYAARRANPSRSLKKSGRIAESPIFLCFLSRNLAQLSPDWLSAPVALGRYSPIVVP